MSYPWMMPLEPSIKRKIIFGSQPLSRVGLTLNSCFDNKLGWRKEKPIKSSCLNKKADKFSIKKRMISLFFWKSPLFNHLWWFAVSVCVCSQESGNSAKIQQKCKVSSKCWRIVKLCFVGTGGNITVLASLSPGGSSFATNLILDLHPFTINHKSQAGPSSPRRLVLVYI